jgi:hypothetical protein
MSTNNENINISSLRTARADTGSGISNPEIELGIPSVKASRNSRQANGRVAANFSDLPEPKPVGVEIKTSVEDEILGKGGIFEDYLAEKGAEIEQVNAAIDEHNRQVAEALGEEVPAEITDEDVKRSREAHIKLDLDDSDNVEESFDEEEYIDPLERELEEDPTIHYDAPYEYRVERNMENGQEYNTVVKVPKPTNEDTSTEEEDIDISSVSFEIDPEDMKDFEEESNDDINKVDEDENLKTLQAEITSKIVPVSNKLNIAAFARTNRPVKADNIIKGSKLNAADWALMSSGKVISMKQFSGTDIDRLGNNEGLSRLSIIKKRYKIFYDHLIGNKPKTMEEWVKSVSYFDNDNLYMTAFIATFAGASYLPIDCPKCSNTFLTDNIPIDSMYKFNDDKSKERFNKIITGQLGESDHGMYVAIDVPISEKFSFTFREPSIYKMLFESSYLDDEFEKKYRAIISVLSYIDEINYIDYENQCLCPIDYKRFPNNKVKDIKSKIIEYAKIINSLSPDEYNIIVAYINAITTVKGDIEYIIPETTCPNCGEIIPERKISAESLVFMRHQLAVLATTSIK